MEENGKAIEIDDGKWEFATNYWKKKTNCLCDKCDCDRILRKLNENALLLCKNYY